MSITPEGALVFWVAGSIIFATVVLSILYNWYMATPPKDKRR